MASTDEELLAGIAGGDPDAAVEFTRRFGDPLLEFLVRAVREPLLAVDLWQETLAQARFHAVRLGSEGGDLGVRLIELAAGVVERSVERGRVVRDCRLHEAGPALELEASDLAVVVEELLRARRSLAALGDDAARRAEQRLVGMPGPHRLRRLRPSGLVRQVGAPDSTWEESR
jgi:hypothetical protein